MAENGKSALLLGSFKGKLRSICGSLRSHGVAPRHVGNLTEAVRQHRANPASVVICDLQPGECLAALDALRAAYPAAPIILLAPSTGWRWVDLLENGAFDVLNQPCDVTDLTWMVRNALDSSAGRYLTKTA